QRFVREGAALARTQARDGRGGKRKLGEELGIDDHPAVLQLRDSPFERDERPRAAGRFDLEQVAGAVIFNRDDFPQDIPRCIDSRQPDDVGVIIFALFERRQRRARDLDQRAAKRFGGRAVGNTVEARDRRLARVSQFHEPPRLAGDEQRLVLLELLGVVGEQFQAQIAFDAVRADDCGERDPTLAALRHVQPCASSAAPSAGSSLDSPVSAFASACWGDSVLGGGTSSAPSAGSAPDSPSLVASGCSAAASSAGASSVSGSALSSSVTASASAVGSAVAASISSATTASASSWGAAAASAASASLAARCSTRSLAFSPGSAFFGLLRAGRSRIPAASRNRSTRSEGCAPTLSQCWIRSASSFTRSGESLASSGL